MAFDSEKFIIDLVRQLNLNNMDDARYNRLTDLQKKKVATKEQNSWKRGAVLPEYDENDGATPPVYTYDGTGAVTDLEETYKKLIVALRDMYADKELRENNPTKDFLAKFYGTGKAVEEYKIDPLSIPGHPNPATDLANYIERNKSHFATILKDSLKEKDLTNLITKLNAGDYVNDTKTLKNLEIFLNSLDYYDKSASIPAPDNHLPSWLKQPAAMATYYGGNINGDIIKNLTKQLNAPKLPTTGLAHFKDEMPKLFGQLVAEDKLREKFISKDNDGDLTKWISKGLDKSNYKTGDNALEPKYNDRKTFWANAKSKVKDFYNDTLGKLFQKHTRHKYQTDARYIVAGLIDKGVKPTDGTAKILNTLDAIMGGLPNPVQDNAKKIKTFFEKHSKQKYFQQALHDGDQMRQLVQEIAKEASRGDGIDMQSAEVALEMLAVMRYTLTTSSIRDKLYKAQVTILSDPAMSYNKGPFKHISAAFDGVIRGIMLGAFEIGNLAKNAINEHGVKFGRGKGRLDKRITDSPDYKDDDKCAKMEYLFGFWDNVNTSTNTKDYNILARHSEVQKDADKPAGVSSITNPITMATIDNPTKQQKQTIDWLTQNHIGRD